MVTALSATPTPGDAGTSTPPYVTLAVTGAPNPPAPGYSSNFATTDGWAGGASGGGTTPTVTASAGVLHIVVASVAGGGAAYYAERTMTSLTIGLSYTFTAKVKQVSSGSKARLVVRDGVGEIASTAYFLPSSSSYTTISVTFTATATSHVARIFVTGNPLQAAKIDVSQVTVRTSSWLGTKVYRTDANGLAVPVRLAPGQDTSGGAMTVTDWEAALTGQVTYTVTDGLGGTANANFTNGAPESVLWVTAPATADPSTGTAGKPQNTVADTITDYDAGRSFKGTVHDVLQRTDAPANPGPLSTRSGRMSILFGSYAAARAFEDLVEQDNRPVPLWLRQPVHPGMDMLFFARSVDLAVGNRGGSKWIEQVTFDEVSAEVAP